MESTNVLDATEKERSFLYGNRSLYCFALSLFCLWITSLALDYIEENSFSRNVELVLVLLPLGLMSVLSFVGCYFGIQGIRYKEVQRWRTILGLFANLLLFLVILIGVFLAHVPQRIEPSNPVPLEAIE